VDLGVAPTKTYDGTRSVPAGQVRYSTNGTAVTPDNTLLQGTLTGTLDSRHVGLRTVTMSGLFSTGQEGYLIDYSPSTITVTPAPLTISAVTDAKAFDGTTRSSAAPTVSGLLGSDTIQDVRQVFTYRQAFGVGRSVLRVSGYALNDGNAGANYSVNDAATAAGTITMKRRSACGWARCTPR
jgi:hypothetical protein